MLTSEMHLADHPERAAYGLHLRLVAIGLCVIWGLMEIVNFAHGEFLMLAMFTLFGASPLHMDPLLSLPFCMILLFLIGVATYFIIIKKIIQAPFLAQILSTFGLGIFLRYLAQFMFSPDFRTIKNPILSGNIYLGGISIGIPQLVASLVCIATFIFLYWFINRTEVDSSPGYQRRPGSASLMGSTATGCSPWVGDRVRLPGRGRRLDVQLLLYLPGGRLQLR